MEDQRIWAFEKSLWTGGADTYRAAVDPECRMVLPTEPFIFDGEAAIAAVSDTPRWEEVDFSETSVARPQDGLIVIAYKAEARRGAESYSARCTSTLRRLGHEEWTVVQHQQTVLPSA